jgi:hypothetical protein
MNGSRHDLHWKYLGDEKGKALETSNPIFSLDSVMAGDMMDIEGWRDFQTDLSLTHCHSSQLGIGWTSKAPVETKANVDQKLNSDNHSNLIILFVKRVYSVRKMFATCDSSIWIARCSTCNPDSEVFHFVLLIIV